MGKQAQRGAVTRGKVKLGFALGGAALACGCWGAAGGFEAEADEQGTGHVLPARLVGRTDYRWARLEAGRSRGPQSPALSSSSPAQSMVLDIFI